MNIDLQQQTQATRGRAGNFHTLAPPTKKIYQFRETKTADGQFSNLPESQSAVNHGIISHFKFSPSTAMPSLASQSQVDIRIPAGSVGVVRDLYLEIDLINNSLNPAILSGGYAHNLLDRIEILAENGSQIVQRWNNTSLQSAVLYDDLQQNGHRLQMSALDPLGVPAAGTTKSYVKLPWSVFSSGHVNLKGIKSDIFIRCVFRPDSDSFSSYPDVCSLTNVQVHVEAINWSTPIERALSNRQRSTVQHYKMWNWVETKEILNLTPSGSFEIRLNSVTGLVSGFFVWVRPNGHTADTTVDSQQLETFQLNDASGKSIIGSSSFDRDVQSIHKEQNNMLSDLVNPFNSKIVGNVLYVPVSFSDKQNLASGSLVGGYYPFSGYERFQFTTGSALVAGSFEVTIVFSQLNVMKSDSGSISVHQT